MKSILRSDYIDFKDVVYFEFAESVDIGEELDHVVEVRPDAIEGSG